MPIAAGIRTAQNDKQRKRKALGPVPTTGLYLPMTVCIRKALWPSFFIPSNNLIGLKSDRHWPFFFFNASPCSLITWRAWLYDFSAFAFVLVPHLFVARKLSSSCVSFHLRRRRAFVLLRFSYMYYVGTFRLSSYCICSLNLPMWLICHLGDCTHFVHKYVCLCWWALAAIYVKCFENFENMGCHLPINWKYVKQGIMNKNFHRSFTTA